MPRANGEKSHSFYFGGSFTDESSVCNALPPTESPPPPPLHRHAPRVLRIMVKPPLQFFLEAIATEPWSDVSILTFADEEAHVNPTFTALQLFQRTGLLGPNVAVYKVRASVFLV